MKATLRKTENFFFTPAPENALNALRISVSLVLLLQAFLLIPIAADLYGKTISGHWNFGRLFGHAGFPRLQLAFSFFHLSGVGEESLIFLAGGLYIVSLISLLWGHQVRQSAAISLLLHFIFLNSNFQATYAVDRYSRWSLFYLCWWPRTPERIRLLLRVVQIHLAMTYAFNGIPKLLSSEWWSGEALFSALNAFGYQRFDFSWLAGFHWLLVFPSIGVIVLEAGYPIFIWLKKTSGPWIYGIVAMHLAVAVFLRMELFGILLACLTPAVFYWPKRQKLPLTS